MTSVQAKSITVTQMRYVRTLKGLSPAHVKLVTKEMARSVEVNFRKRSNVLNQQSVSQADI